MIQQIRDFNKEIDDTSTFPQEIYKSSNTLVALLSYWLLFRSALKLAKVFTRAKGRKKIDEVITFFDSIYQEYNGVSQGQ